MGKVMRALGLMSGTSLDGIDVALIDTDGENHVVRGPSMTFPYGDEMRQMLVKALADVRDIKDRTERPGILPHAERELTEPHGAAVSGFLRKQGIKREDVDVIAAELGVSRQTLYRRLRAEEVTFEELLDQLRHRLALRYLRDEHLSVKAASYRLGFSEPAAFSRAFKRWTGASPSAASA